MNKHSIILFLLLWVHQSLMIPTQPTYYLFSHGIVNNYTQAHQYARQYTNKGTIVYNNRSILDKNVLAFNYPDVANNFFRINRYEASLGQDHDVQRLTQAYTQACSYIQHQFLEPHIVLIGISRGAVTALNFMAITHAPHIAALIVESPYDSVQSIVEQVLKRFHCGWISSQMGNNALPYIFRQYSPQGIQAIDLVADIPKSLPIMLICSKEDKLVPYTSTINLYKQLRETGHSNTYLLVLEHGKHSKILHGADGETYQKVVHAFYKQYQLPHDENLANAGIPSLSTCQPLYA